MHLAEALPVREYKIDLFPTQIAPKIRRPSRSFHNKPDMLLDLGVTSTIILRP